LKCTVHFYNSFSLSARRPARGGASENPEAGGETEAGGEWRTISAVAVHSPVWALYSSASQFSTICSRIIWYWWSLSSCGRVSLATGCQILLCSMIVLQSSSSVKKVCAVQFCEAVIRICTARILENAPGRSWSCKCAGCRTRSRPGRRVCTWPRARPAGRRTPAAPRRWRIVSLATCPHEHDNHRDE